MGCRCNNRIKTRQLKPGHVSTPEIKPVTQSKLGLLKEMWETAKKESKK
jgi:hypothetical protein